MGKAVGIWQLWGFAVTAFLGTVLHFAYDWLGGARWVAPLSGVNESTWEHMKLLFWPMLLFAVIQSFFFRDRGDFLCIKLRGTLLGLILIPVLFYTYNGAVGKSPDWLNLAIFFFSLAVAYVYEARLLYREERPCRPRLAAALLIGIAVLFVLFTLRVPEIGIFRDPVTGTYGIPK